MTKVNLPDGRGFREMGIATSDIEYLGTKTTEELVMDELTKGQPLAAFEIAQRTKIPHQTITSCLKRLIQHELITHKNAVIRLNGRRRNVVQYRIVKK